MAQSVEIAREYTRTNVEYLDRFQDFTITKSDLRSVGQNIQEGSNKELIESAKEIRRRKGQGLNTRRFYTYISQSCRRPKSLEQNQEEQRSEAAEKVRAADEKRIEEENQQRNLFNFGQNEDDAAYDAAVRASLVASKAEKALRRKDYTGPTKEELLVMAGGDLSMVHGTGDAGTELRSVLAQRAVFIKKKLRKRAIEQKKAPPKNESFYTREILPFFREDYYTSSDEDEEDEEDKQKRIKMERKAERKEKRKAERETKALILGDDHDEY
jgi:hypothetical protein